MKETSSTWAHSDIIHMFTRGMAGDNQVCSLSLNHLHSHSLCKTSGDSMGISACQKAVYD